MSMKPGATTQSEASSSRSPRRSGRISVTTPPAIATSAARPGAPLPSTTVPPRMTMSAGTRPALLILGRIDHELEQVPVRVPHVHARSLGTTATVAFHRALLDLGARPAEEPVQRCRRSVPHEAEITARWRRRGCAQAEALALPRFRAVQVDHLVADVNGHDVGMLRDFETQGAVEGDHRFGALHRQ